MIGIEPAPPPAELPPPPPPDVDTGVVLGDLRVGTTVKVWWLSDWWYGKVKHCSARSNTVSVVFIGDSNSTSGIKPQHVQIVDEYY